MKSRKGEWGYFSSEKRRRILTTSVLFAIPIFIYVTSFLYFGTRRNLMTVVAMVGIIPAAISCVGLIMILMRRSLPEEEYRELHAHEGNLTVAYELYLTSEKQNALVDCLAICGSEVVGYVSDPKTDLHFAQDHLQKMLRAASFKVSVHMLGDRRQFIRRMDSMNEHADDLRKGLTFTPGEAWKGYGREDMIRHSALSVSL